MQDKPARPPEQHNEHELSYSIDVTALTPVGRSYTIRSGDDECARLAVRLGLQRVDSLTAVLDVKVVAGGHIKVTGRLDADVVQTCGVTLELVAAKITGAVSAMFMTEERAAREKAKRERAKARNEDEVVVDVSEDDPPEVARDGRIDLGEVAIVHLALALDPYPRAAGAAFDPQVWGLEPDKGPDTPGSGPFAALAKLKSPGPRRGQG